MPLSDKEYERMFARLELLEGRIQDVREKNIRMEQQQLELTRTTAERWENVAGIGLRLAAIEKLVMEGKGGWRVILAVGAAIGFTVTVALEAWRAFGGK